MSLDESFIVERIADPNNEVFESYVLKNKPFVITEVVTKWPAFRSWKDPDYLLEKIGSETQIPIRTNFVKAHMTQAQNLRDKTISKTEEWLGESKTLQFGTFLKHWLEKKPVWSPEEDLKSEFYYLASLPIHKYFSQLSEDFTVPHFPKLQNKSGNLWIGNQGQITPVHFDFSTGDPGMDGIHAVVKGRKVFKLFDPESNSPFFPKKNLWGKFHQAVVETNGLPDPVRFPSFERARYVEVDLKEGEMLFIPKLWWHHVTTLEQSVSVNFWFQHLGSEKLKLNRHWEVIEQYLMSVEEMEISREKMKNVLQFFGEKVDDERLEHFMKNKLDFMLLPGFIESFANGTKAPYISCDEAREFGRELCDKVERWIRERKAKNEIKS